MLFGVHVYARAKVVPDLMVSRGEEAYRAARLLGDQAHGVPRRRRRRAELLELGDVAEAERWLGLAATVAAARPRRVAPASSSSWRGMVRAAAGDADGMRRHLEQAVALATTPGPRRRRAARRSHDSPSRRRGLAPRRGDDELLQLAERSAHRRRRSSSRAPAGAPAWGPQADAALATVALARGDMAAAVAAAGCGGPGAPGGRPRGRASSTSCSRSGRRSSRAGRRRCRRSCGLPAARARADRPGHARRGDARPLAAAARSAASSSRWPGPFEPPERRRRRGRRLRRRPTSTMSTARCCAC